MKLYLKFSVLAVISTAVQAQNETDTVKHKDCELDVYYAPLYAKGEPETWTREDIRDHLISRHFDTVPAIPTKDNPSDIVEALIDLWPGPNDPERNIYLIYRNEELPKRPALALETWKKESFWPAERGAVPGTDAFTDVHQTAPGDWSVLADKAKLNKENHIFYGSCGTVNLAKACVSPANVETAPDTAQDSKIYTPPEVNRGDIARALFYAEMRYGDELGFMLSDCPPFSKTTFGYRSELLRWHDADKVSAEELTRNERGCSHWQGNRNIFVDFPQLVNKFYGVPDEVPAGMLQYSQCMGETAGPTATPNDCSSIRPGDISIYVFNSENPDQIALFPVDNIPVTVGSLYITDNAWDGTKLLDVEGTIEYKIPNEGIEAGRLFGYGVSMDTDTGEWENVGDSDFHMNAEGDNLMLYCINADDEPHFINAISYAGPWVEAGKESYDITESALPERLAGVGNVVLKGHPNWLYNGTQSGNRDILVPSFGDSANWKGSDLRYQLSGSWSLQSTAFVTTLAGLVLSSVALLLV